MAMIIFQQSTEILCFCLTQQAGKFIFAEKPISLSLDIIDRVDKKVSLCILTVHELSSLVLVHSCSNYGISHCLGACAFTHTTFSLVKCTCKLLISAHNRDCGDSI
jgi:hypothetical protein